MLGLRGIAAAVVACALACVAHGQTVVNGWTQFTASADTRTVYVSTSGSDSNNGLTATAPKRTISAGAALMRSGYPDWLLLRSGDTFHEVFPSWTKGGRSASEPMRIGVYGGADRATINCGTSTGLGGFVSGATPKSHLAVTDLAFIAHTNTGSSNTAGVQFLGSYTHLLFENVLIKGFHTNIVFQSNRFTETMNNIRFRRCVVVDAFTTGSGNSEGCYLAGIDQLLLEDCVFDHNGWNESVAGAIPNIYRHNVYIQGHNGQSDDCTNVTVRGLISARAAATGMQQRPGGLCDDSLFIANPMNLVFGTTGGTVQNCVVVGSRNIDASTPRGVAYNLVNGTELRKAVNCIAVGQPSAMGTANVYAYAIDSAPNVRLENCVSWRWKSASGSGSAVNATNAPMPTVEGGNMEQTAPAYTVSVEEYMRSMGGTQTVAAFMNECRLQSRANWRPQYTAGAFNQWARAAFGMASPPPPPPPAPCYANCDGSVAAPIVNVADFTCFMTWYAAGDPRANCDGSTSAPVLNVSDFSCFLQQAAQGCP